MTIPFDDLLIVAWALEKDYGVATRNLLHFRKILGLKLVELPPPASALG